MAALARNRYYQWYLREVEAGQLELPEYDENEKGDRPSCITARCSVVWRIVTRPMYGPSMKEYKVYCRKCQ
ncbi:uncharacterized protein BDW43DRAFT_292427 [Aspergillus alliaceus]|uniref:uncharacterized protein n=1 Tax=Petromyces alliaceus TaxID=209559 RepID=UPI0012A6DC8B|nr:uncharacterized protein BDW43DRAFT_292427 [Aspergillus alliaceus]KAB8228050.1 hypothetical protein BDW43DRAFT_292427 [Aspergillus alliaceus]